MRRRTLLRGLAAAPLVSLVSQVPAQAAASYYVATTEQVQNKVLVFDRDAAWTDANIHWSFSPGTGSWSNLSDVKIRNTEAQGWIALMAASGGKVGIVDVGTEANTELNDLKWSATPGGNPHAIERVPGNGSVVTASSDGYLTVYAPTAVSDLSTLAKVQTVNLAGAHGVLWDPTDKLLWAIGQDKLVTFTVEGTYRNTRLKSFGTPVSLGTNLGHDLQPDYSNPQKLLCTATDGVYEISTTGGVFTKTKISSETRVKSYVRHASGEDISVRADNVGPRTWGSPTVRFSASADRTRTGAEFYKARIWTTGFE